MIAAIRMGATHMGKGRRAKRRARLQDLAAGLRVKLHEGTLAEADLDELVAALDATTKPDGRPPRQRLLYLQATTPSIRSAVIGMALHEPVPGSITQITADAHWPYATVHDAILDGWQAIHFPQQRVPFDDHEIDVLGYEFILQKMEEATDG